MKHICLALTLLCSPIASALTAANSPESSPVARVSRPGQWAVLTAPAKQDLVLEAAEDRAGTNLLDLVHHYESLTGVHVMASQETRTLLRNSTLGIDGELKIDAADVPSFFHTVMRSSDFAIWSVRDTAPLIMGIVSLKTQARNTIRGNATFVDESRLAELKNYPAILVTTAVTLEHVDVRQLSNAMRTMITDANTEQMLPAGNTHSMVLTGFPDRLVSLIKQLRVIDEASRQEKMPAHASAVVRLKFAEALSIERAINRAFSASTAGVAEDGAAPPKSVAVAADVRTNSLIVVGRAERVKEVEALIAQLDIEVKE